MWAPISLEFNNLISIIIIISLEPKQYTSYACIIFVPNKQYLFDKKLALSLNVHSNVLRSGEPNGLTQNDKCFGTYLRYDSLYHENLTTFYYIYLEFSNYKLKCIGIPRIWCGFNRQLTFGNNFLIFSLYSFLTFPVKKLFFYVFQTILLDLIHEWKSIFQD